MILLDLSVHLENWNSVSLSSIQIVFGIFTLMQLFEKLRNHALLVDGMVNSLAGAQSFSKFLFNGKGPRTKLKKLIDG